MENYWKEFYKQVFNSLDWSKQMEMMPVDEYLESLKYEQYFKDDLKNQNTDRNSDSYTRSLSKWSFKEDKEQKKTLKKEIRKFDNEQV